MLDLISLIGVNGTDVLSGYIVVEDNSLLAASLGSKRLPETLFRMLSSDSYGKVVIQLIFVCQTFVWFVCERKEL